jgi:hypothetical protein
MTIALIETVPILPVDSMPVPSNRGASSPAIDVTCRIQEFSCYEREMLAVRESSNSSWSITARPSYDVCHSVQLILPRWLNHPSEPGPPWCNKEHS